MVPCFLENGDPWRRPVTFAAVVTVADGDFFADNVEPSHVFVPLMLDL